VKTKLSTGAIADLQRLREFLAEKNPAAARQAVQTIVDGFDLIATFPRSGMHVGESGYRRHIVGFGSGAYMIDYEVDERDGAVLILRIRHSRENR